MSLGAGNGFSSSNLGNRAVLVVPDLHRMKEGNRKNFNNQHHFTQVSFHRLRMFLSWLRVS